MESEKLMEQTIKQDKGLNKNVLLAVVVAANFINPMMGAAVNVALPNLAKELDINAVGQAWVAMSYLLTAAIFLIPFGKAGDMLGRKKLFLYGNILFMLTSFLGAVSTSSTMLIISRLLQGIGGAMMISTSMALLLSVFPPKDRGKVLGFSVSATYLGLATAPLIGGFMTQAFGWRSLFILNGSVGVLISIAILLKVKVEYTEKSKEKFDFVGSSILLVAISSLMYGFSKLPKLENIILTAVGIIGLIIFVIVEKRKANPVLNIKLFTHNKTFSFANLTALINYAATFAITFVMSLYLQNVKGFKPSEAGMVLIAQPIMMALVSSFSGKMSDKKDPRILASIGMAIIVAGLFLLTFLVKETSVKFIVGSLLLLGTGFGLFSSPNTNSAMSSVDRDVYGVASATLSTMRSMGMMFSMAIAAMATYIFIGNQKISSANIPQYMKSVKVVFIIFTVLCFVGIFTSLAGRKKKTVNEIIS